ncbi:hypothetical protein P9112_013144 [Eukaryota sp. TZLM1-RC]
MGVLLSTLHVLGRKQPNEVILDFLNVPSSFECDVVKSVQKVLNEGNVVLERFRAFKSESAPYIKKALQNPLPEHEKQALTAVIPSVELARTIYDYGLQLASIIPNLLVLFAEAQNNQNIEYQQVICRTIAFTFDFVLGFDQSKRVSPDVLKDVGVYRRLTSKSVIPEDGYSVKTDPIKDSELVMILAQATPFTTLMGTKLKELMLSKDSDDSLLDPLCELSNLCSHVLNSHKFSDPKLNVLLMRALTGAILLYDYSTPQGAFHKGTKINTRLALNALKKFENESRDLLSMLKYSSSSFSHSSTPKSIRNMLSSY